MATVAGDGSRVPAGPGFQSIGVTNEWRHQWYISHDGIVEECFQSIGVTNEWRQDISSVRFAGDGLCFQSIGVTNEWRPERDDRRWRHPLVSFPINRRHQRMATIHSALVSHARDCRFQSIGVTNEWRPDKILAAIDAAFTSFPINRRHQRMATERRDGRGRLKHGARFQSIGATNEWRPDKLNEIMGTQYKVSNQ